MTNHPSRLRSLGITILLAASVAIPLGACHLKTSEEDIKAETSESHYTGKLAVSPEFAKSLPRRVAILPFTNKTESTGAEVVVRQSFSNHFAAKNYEDTESTVVDRKLAAAGLETAEKAIAKTPQELGAILRVDAVIEGEITHFDRLYAVIGSLVSVGARVRMFDTRTGEMLWDVEDVARGQDGGVPTSIWEAAGKAAQAAWNMRQIGLMRASDDLFREMVKVIPEPTSTGAPTAPVITSLIHDSAGVTRRAGDKIQFVLYGEPDCDASVDLGTFKKGIALKEKKDGVYEGVYLVKTGDEARDIAVKGTLENKLGGRSEWPDPLGLISIDTKPPATPQDLTAEAGDGSATLQWKKGAEPDLAGYRVYRSSTPLSGFEKALDTEMPQAKIAKLENGKKVYFRVTGRDKAGNESEPAGPADVLPLKPGPTDVPAAIPSGATWPAASSPYIVKTAAALPRGASLSIEPGTEIVLEADLTVEGTLAAKGTAEKPIRVQGKGGALVLRGAGPETSLAGWHLTGAGIRVDGGSPVIEAAVVESAPVGITVTGGAKPTLRACRIRGSKGHGLVVDGSSILSAEDLESAENGGHGIRCDGASAGVAGARLWGNKGAGLRSIKCSAKITKSSIQKNGGGGVVNDASSPEAVQAPENWWGSPAPFEVARAVQGRVEIGKILDGEPGKGGLVDVRFAGADLAGKLETDTYLIPANGPFSLAGEVVVREGATLYVAPGTELRYVSASAKIVLDGGRLVAEGTAETPIRFTSGKNPPHPGDYATAIEVRAPASSGKPNVLKHASVQFAAYGLTVNAGEFEIAYCLIRDNLQSGVKVGGTGAPKLTSNTITENRGLAGVEVSEGAAPRLEGNNIHGNSWAVQSGSERFIFAEGNWWGAAPPDAGLFIGNVDWEHWLEGPAPKAPKSENP